MVCHAGCCRSFAVPVTGADILRIQREQQLSFWDFVCRWEDPESKIARNYAPHFHFADEPDTPFVVCLTHTASQSFPETSKCGFLVEDAAHERSLRWERLIVKFTRAALPRAERFRPSLTRPMNWR